MKKLNLKKYTEFAVKETVALLGIDSPTGYTEEAARWVLGEFEKLGYAPQLTVKGGVLVKLSDGAACCDNNADLLNDPEDFIYYKPTNSYTTEYYTQGYGFSHEGELIQEIGDISSMYMTYMGGDGYVCHIKTDVKNGRRLCVVKDSYGNAEIPFYTSSFEEIFVVDMRYFEINLVQFCKDMKITDMLFTMCTYSAVGTNADNLEVLRTQSIPINDPIDDLPPLVPIQEESPIVNEENHDDNIYEDNNDEGYDNGDDGYGDENYY